MKNIKIFTRGERFYDAFSHRVLNNSLVQCRMKIGIWILKRFGIFMKIILTHSKSLKEATSSTYESSVLFIVGTSPEEGRASLAPSKKERIVHISDWLNDIEVWTSTQWQWIRNWLKFLIVNMTYVTELTHSTQLAIYGTLIENNSCHRCQMPLWRSRAWFSYY